MVHKPAPTLETGPRVFLRSARYRRLDARFIMYLRISKQNARFSEAKLDKMCTYLTIAHFPLKYLFFNLRLCFHDFLVDHRNLPVKFSLHWNECDRDAILLKCQHCTHRIDGDICSTLSVGAGFKVQ